MIHFLSEVSPFNTLKKGTVVFFHSSHEKSTIIDQMNTFPYYHSYRAEIFFSFGALANVLGWITGVERLTGLSEPPGVHLSGQLLCLLPADADGRLMPHSRSEEHTSELQSR